MNLEAVQLRSGRVARGGLEPGSSDLDVMAVDLSAEIASLSRRLSAGTLELLVLIGQADSGRVWESAGALSCAAWLAGLCDIELSTAHSQVRVARAMRTYQVLHEAMVNGELSYAKARALVPHLDQHNAAALVELATSTRIGRLGAAIAAWSMRNEDDVTIQERQRQARSVTWRTDADGMVTITARLTPESAAQVCALIDHHVASSSSSRDIAPTGAMSLDDPTVTNGAGTEGQEISVGGDAVRDVVEVRPSLRQQRADALVTLLTTPSGGRVETEVIVHVSPDGNHLSDGTPLTNNTVTSLLPESFISLLIHDTERHPIDASPRRRFPTRRQRRVIDARYPECAHPGCEAEKFLQYDHERPYGEGGLTVLGNLQRLCGPHNRDK